MRILLLAASGRQPKWVEDGYAEYARRLRGRCRLELRVIALARRTRSMPAERALEQEGARMLAAVPDGAHVVELAEDGEALSTAALAGRLEAWLGLGAPVCLLLGGPDGISPRCSARADERWSLSPLTLPHGLARIVVAEALYRSLSLLEGHPYHRA